MPLLGRELIGGYGADPFDGVADVQVPQPDQPLLPPVARAERLGGRRVLDPVDTPVSRIAVFTDPDGNRIGLVSR